MIASIILEKASAEINTDSKDIDIHKDSQPLASVTFKLKQRSNIISYSLNHLSFGFIKNNLEGSLKAAYCKITQMMTSRNSFREQTCYLLTTAETAELIITQNNHSVFMLDYKNDF